LDKVVSFDVQDGVAVALIDRPPVNAIDASVRAGLGDAVRRAQADPAIKALVIACAGRTFLSGADLGELGSAIAEPNYYDTLALIEACSKPVIASLHGTALGGGLETAMACHYRCAVRTARVGMPEMNLGIIPGAGGTQRLPRLIGAAMALELMLTAEMVDAERAKTLGIVDEVFDGDPTVAGVAYARRLIAQGAGPRRTGERAVDSSGFDDAGVKAILDKASRGLKGRTTQFESVRTVKASIDLPFAEGLAFEKQVSDASLMTTESQALRHVFFAERETGRIPGLPASVKPLEIKTAAVIGAGTMGGGITMAFADSGTPVTLIDISQEALDRGLKTIRANYETTVKRGRLTPEDLEKRMALISSATSSTAAKDADVVVEAVFENMELKKRVLAELDGIVRPDAILATNTSTLSITELSSVTKHPTRVVGLHFFVPANVMRLLEIVRGASTSPQAIVTGLEVAKKLRKVGVVVGDGFGFVGNRMMLDGYFRETEQLMLEGATPEQIDRVVEGFGFAMGPNKVNDMAGVDVGTRTREELLKREARPDPYHVVSDALTAMGRLGQKTGAGVYRYVAGDRTTHPDPEVLAVAKRLADERGIVQREISDEEVLDRCILPLINIGAQILEDGLAYRASDIDVVWTSGYGFPRWRGGPLFYGDTLGLPKVLEKVRAYHAKLGSYWTPSPLLERLVAQGLTFAQWDQALEKAA